MFELLLHCCSVTHVRYYASNIVRLEDFRVKLNHSLCISQIHLQRHTMVTFAQLKVYGQV